jgi:haloacid dehalogenase superfamily, subfamily IA, variant 3 with third motif having DD or ED/beta-phosphoglucomutase family hydrolase
MNDFAVIFDMDGVLVDNNEYHNIAWVEYCKRKNLKISQEEIVSRYGTSNIEFFDLLYGNTLSKEETDRLGEEKEALYREIYEEHIKPVDGLVEFLKGLKEHGFKLAVATSAIPNNLNFVLDKINIRHFFDKLADSSMVKRGKPDPDVYLKASELLDIPPSRCLVFEDAVMGVKAAKSAQMKVVAITSTFKPEDLMQADRIINSFTEITPNDVEAMLKS